MISLALCSWIMLPYASNLLVRLKIFTKLFNLLMLLYLLPLLRDWLTFQITLHKKWSFPWRISSVNVTKSTGNWCHDMFIGQRTNRSYGQVKRSHSIPLVLKFYVLILIYFRAIFIEIFFRFWSFVFVGFVLVFSFVNFWYFFYFAKFKCDEMLGSRL